VTEAAINFEVVARVLGRNHPSEIHGIIYGMLCVDNRVSHAACLAVVRDELSGEDLMVPNVEEVLGELFSATGSQLNDDHLSFSPLLPDQEVPLSQRAQALAYWCRGFLAGLGLGGLGRHPNLGLAVQEFLREIAAISRLDGAVTEADDEEEASYGELLEHLSRGVSLLEQELRGDREASAAGH
jgi:uncharacterized protein YgfB (UPF0149 family)